MSSAVMSAAMLIWHGMTLIWKQNSVFRFPWNTAYRPIYFASCSRPLELFCYVDDDYRPGFVALNLYGHMLQICW
jgi:hypothetical protein